MATKEALSRELSLQTVNPDLPFVLRADASGKAIGAVLEQVPAGVKMEPTIKELIRASVTVPVAVLSRLWPRFWGSRNYTIGGWMVGVGAVGGLGWVGGVALERGRG